MPGLRHGDVQDIRKEITAFKGEQIAIVEKEIALRIAGVARNKKAEDVIVLDLRSLSGFCDYFVIASAASLRQANAVAQAIIEELAKDRIKPLLRVSPNDESGWVVVDFSGVVAHIFYSPLREFYSLERLWSQAKKVRIPRK